MLHPTVSTHMGVAKPDVPDVPLIRQFSPSPPTLPPVTHCNKKKIIFLGKNLPSVDAT